MFNTEYSYLYRGDTREAIFDHGFESRDPEVPISMEDEGIDTNTAVCLTPYFDAAPLFPIEFPDGSQAPVSALRKFPKSTNIYLVRVKTEDLFLTHKKQIEMNSELTFAREVAIKKVAADQVVAKIRADRFFYALLDYPNTNWDQSGEYVLKGSVEYNPRVEKESWFPQIKETFDSFIGQRLGKAFQLPYHNHEAPLKTFSIDEHKQHKRQTKAHILEALTKIGMPFTSKEIQVSRTASYPVFNGRKVVETTLSSQFKD